MKALPLLVLALACASCRTVESHSVAATPPPTVRVAGRARTWEVRRGEERLGHVVLFQERGLADDSVFVVRNAWNQDLGMIDGLGRAYRYMPHLEDPTWVGSGTIAVGAERILGAEGCTLVELPATPADRFETADLAAEATQATEALEPTARPSNASRADGGLPQSH